MSLTQTFGVFGAVDQVGLNKALTTLFTARPHYLHYGSPPFVLTSSVQVTEMDPIGFPGVPGGIPWAVDFTIPQVDLYPPDGVLPPPLVLNPNQLAVSTKVTITIGCVQRQNGEKGGMHPIATELDVVAVGHPVSRFFSPGVGDVSFVIDQVAVQGIAPPSLAELLECLIIMLLNAALSQARLPLDIIDGGGFFKLIVQAGPEVNGDQIKLWGDVS